MKIFICSAQVQHPYPILRLDLYYSLCTGAIVHINIIVQCPQHNYYEYSSFPL